jgi:hypothetical protein
MRLHATALQTAGRRWFCCGANDSVHETEAAGVPGMEVLQGKDTGFFARQPRARMTNTPLRM